MEAFNVKYVIHYEDGSRAFFARKISSPTRWEAIAEAGTIIDKIYTNIKSYNLLECHVLNPYAAHFLNYARPHHHEKKAGYSDRPTTHI